MTIFKRIRKFINWLIQNFGPLIVFLITNNIAGLKPAIIATIVWSIGEFTYIVGWKREKPTQFFYFSVCTTFIFGMIDLYSDNPFLFRYESVLTNILTGIYFGATIFVGKPLIQEFAERANPDDIKKPGSTIYLRYLTMVWTLYFFAKAVVYFYLANSDLSIERVTIIRSALGPISFAALLGGERVLRPFLVKGLKAIGKLPVSGVTENIAL
jgi:intracellular septation protein A